MESSNGSSFTFEEWCKDHCVCSFCGVQLSVLYLVVGPADDDAAVVPHIALSFPPPLLRTTFHFVSWFGQLKPVLLWDARQKEKINEQLRVKNYFTLTEEKESLRAKEKRKFSVKRFAAAYMYGDKAGTQGACPTQNSKIRGLNPCPPAWKSTVVWICTCRMQSTKGLGQKHS